MKRKRLLLKNDSQDTLYQIYNIPNIHYQAARKQSPPFTKNIILTLREPTTTWDKTTRRLFHLIGRAMKRSAMEDKFASPFLAQIVAWPIVAIVYSFVFECLFFSGLIHIVLKLWLIHFHHWLFIFLVFKFTKAVHEDETFFPSVGSELLWSRPTLLGYFLNNFQLFTFCFKAVH